MIKFILGAVIFIAMTYVGIGVERYYKVRFKLIDDLVAYLDRASREVSFMKTEMVNLTKLDCGNVQLGKILNSVNESLIKNKPLKVESVYLKNNECRSLEEFFKGLSESDFESQKQIFKAYIGEFNEIRTKTEKEKKERGSLSKKLFALCGLAVMIMIL